MKKLLIAGALCLFGRFGWASDFSSSANGTTASEFLELGAGARALTMGEAYTAVADDASAAYWNPAGLTQIQNRSLTLMHASYIASSFFEYGAFAQNLGEYGTVAAGYQYFSAGTLTQTDASGGSVGSFSPYDLAATLAYAHKLDGSISPFLDGASVGVGLKFIQSTVLTSAQTEAVDVGLLSPSYLNGKLKFGFDVSNFGRTIKFDQGNENLPLTFKVGSSYQILGNWLASMDVALPRDSGPWVGLGTEYQFVTSGPWHFAGRAGFNSQTLGDIPGFSGISFGIGVGYKGASLDYGFVPFGALGDAQILSITSNF